MQENIPVTQGVLEGINVFPIKETELTMIQKLFNKQFGIENESNSSLHFNLAIASLSAAFSAALTLYTLSSESSKIGVLIGILTALTLFGLYSLFMYNREEKKKVKAIERIRQEANAEFDKVRARIGNNPEKLAAVDNAYSNLFLEPVALPEG